MHVQRFQFPVGFDGFASTTVEAQAMGTGCLPVCPFFMGVTETSVQDVYRLAFERAVSDLRPPKHERLLLAGMN